MEDGLPASLDTYPSWRGESIEMAEQREAIARHLEVSRRNTYPTAMERYPLVFFRHAKMVAPHT